jgi:hypothetical protein
MDEGINTFMIIVTHNGNMEKKVKYNSVPKFAVKMRKDYCLKAKRPSIDQPINTDGDEFTHLNYSLVLIIKLSLAEMINRQRDI